MQLSDYEEEEDANSIPSQDSFCDKVGAYTRKKSDEAAEEVNQGVGMEDRTQRFSGRLAGKNYDDVPVLDRAMSLAAAKNLEGEGNCKTGTTAGRKAAGKNCG